MSFFGCSRIHSDASAYFAQGYEGQGEASLPRFEASKRRWSEYSLMFRDRCRSGLSGTPGKRVLVKANRGFESLPVRPYFAPNASRWRFEGLGGQGVPPAGRDKRMGPGQVSRGPNPDRIQSSGNLGAHCACAERTSPSTRRGSRKGFGEMWNQSLPVRPYFAPNASRRRFEGLGGQGESASKFADGPPPRPYRCSYA